MLGLRAGDGVRVVRPEAGLRLGEVYTVQEVGLPHSEAYGWVLIDHPWTGTRFWHGCFERVGGTP